MRTTRLLSTFVLFGVSACAAAVPPDRPTWDVDVQPVIQGNCSHCHGETAAVTGQTFRFDVCDPAPFMAINVGGVSGAKTLAGTIAAAILGKGFPRMPPPPAEPLGDYESKVLQNWTNHVTCDKSGSNHPPDASLFRTYTDGDDFHAVIDVTDPDGDQALGTMSVGNGGPVTIPATGRHDLIVPGGPTSKQVHVVITDGYSDPVTLDLDQPSDNGN